MEVKSSHKRSDTTSVQTVISTAPYFVKRTLAGEDWHKCLFPNCKTCQPLHLTLTQGLGISAAYQLQDWQCVSHRRRGWSWVWIPEQTIFFFRIDCYQRFLPMRLIQTLQLKAVAMFTTIVLLSSTVIHRLNTCLVTVMKTLHKKLIKQVYISSVRQETFDVQIFFNNNCFRNLVYYVMADQTSGDTVVFQFECA